MSKYWDVYSKDKTPLNKIVKRGYTFLPDEYHLGVIALIVNSEGKILMTKRSMIKEKFPGKWEFTQGGVKAGESSRDGIIREINEEIGITLGLEDCDTNFILSYIAENTILDVWLFKLDIDVKKLLFKNLKSMI